MTTSDSGAPGMFARGGTDSPARDVALAYNYARFRPSEQQREQILVHGLGGPKIGDLATDFRATDLDGTEVALSDFRGKVVVLETGSASCPMFEQHITRMNALAYRFPDVVFLVLYTREAHPGSNLRPHRSPADKIAAATLLRRQDQEGRRILIDSLDGEVHRAYGSMPNTVHLIDADGTVVFRSMWNDPTTVGEALTKMVAGADPSELEPRFRPAPPAVMWRILRRAGRQALWDMALASRKLWRPLGAAARGGRFPLR
ncbi:peroxiredoxin family protein [Mycobacterium spongiae]|uniref:Redoxin domain-containing protein n=1 Tax=Mycobacterium spongiae TaxID=886343 RepID=A0A975JUB8_9MYCO|nr:TlpA disulfide reductase family protein [Mycobacterium spongiae]QUR65806.1 redoxin domain-containing protein [Mycobacterium spongiae]